MSQRAVGGEKRQHIVETAYRLFKHHGFHATGIDRIIAEAGVAKMTMYRHFPAKDALIVAVLDWRAARFERQLDRLAETSPTPQRTIEGIFDWYEHWFESTDFHGCLFQHALGEFGAPGHPVFEAVARQKSDLCKRIRYLVARSLPEGIPEVRAEAVATTLVMLIEGATMLAQLGQGRGAIDTARLAAAAVLSDADAAR